MRLADVKVKELDLICKNHKNSNSDQSGSMSIDSSMSYGDEEEETPIQCQNYRVSRESWFAYYAESELAIFAHQKKFEKCMKRAYQHVTLTFGTSLISSWTIDLIGPFGALAIIL